MFSNAKEKSRMKLLSSNNILGLFRVAVNNVQFCFMRLTGRDVVCKGKCTSRISNEFNVSRKGHLRLGYHVGAQKGCRFLVRNQGRLEIGSNVAVNSNCIVACHDCISIGDNCEFGPNVLIYDHDHDFRQPGGMKSRLFKTAPVSVGEGTWLAANVTILRGTTIGKNCVIGAGVTLRGITVPDNTLVIADQNLNYKEIVRVDNRADNLV